MTVPKYDGTVVLHIWRKVRWYCGLTVQVRRYFTSAKSTTVPKYDGTVVLQKGEKYDGTAVLQKRRKVRRYCSTTVQV